jgi:hypothetical protein
MYKLFSDCKITLGYIRSCIYDLGRNKYDFIPNDVAKQILDNDFTNICEEYLIFLKNNEYVFQLEENEIELFPLLENTFYSSSIISSIIIDIKGSKKISNLIDIIVDELNVQEIFIISGDSSDNQTLISFIEKLYFTSLKTIELVISKNQENIINKINNNRIKNIYVYESNETKIKNLNKRNSYIVYRTEKIENITPKEQHPNFFNVNLKTYTESLERHLYFNQKIYFGKYGEIKNSPESHMIYGNVNELKNKKDLYNIISNSNFKQLWFVKKEECDVCCHCEFRNMCIDNRIPVQRNKDKWFHKNECNYNPYIGKWRGEDGYLSLVDCEIHSGVEGFFINHNRIEEINQLIWNEN